MYSFKKVFVLFFLKYFICSISIYAQKNNKKLSYGYPSEVSMDSLYIHTKVDSLINFGIQNKAFPGAQVLVAKKHKIIFHKAYGHHTYKNNQKVNLDDIYDLASVTKIIGPTLALMKLHSDGKLILDKPFSDYWKPWKRRKNKKN